MFLDKPSAPTGLKAINKEVMSVDLEWTKVAGATKYYIRQDNRDVATTKMTKQPIKNLAGGTKYKFSVAAENAAGMGPYSTVLEVTTEKYGMYNMQLVLS